MKKLSISIIAAIILASCNMTYFVASGQSIDADDTTIVDIDFSEYDTSDGKEVTIESNDPILGGNGASFKEVTTVGDAEAKIVKDGERGNALRLASLNEKGQSVKVNITLPEFDLDAATEKVIISYDMRAEDIGMYPDRFPQVSTQGESKIFKMTGMGYDDIVKDTGEYRGTVLDMRLDGWDTKVDTLANCRDDYKTYAILCDLTYKVAKVYSNGEFVREYEIPEMTDVGMLVFSLKYDTAFMGVEQEEAEKGVYFIDNIKVMKTDGKLWLTDSSIKNGDENIKKDAPIYFWFNAPVSDASRTMGNFKLYENGVLLTDDDYQLEYNPDKTAVILIKEGGLLADSEYKIEIEKGLVGETEDIVSEAAYEISFSTAREYKASNLTALSVDGYLKIEADISCNGENPQEVMFIAGAYDDNHMLCQMKTINANLEAERKISFAFPLGSTEVSDIVLYVWSGDGKIKPLIERTDMGSITEKALPTELFVALDGASSGDGSINNPFDSIETARDHIAKQSTYPEGGYVVNLREGTYKISNTIEFSKEHSGTKEYPIVYRGYLNDKVVLDASLNLSYGDIEDYSDKIKKIDLSQINNIDTILGTVKNSSDLNDYSTNDNVWSELLIGERAMTMARYPNDSMMKMGSLVTNNSKPDGKKLKWKLDPATAPSDDILAALVDAPDLFAFNCFIPNYEMKFEQIGAVDAKNKTLELKDYRDKAVNNDGHAKSYFLANALALVDAEGEYYIDREAKKLYFIPPQGMENEPIKLTCLQTSLLKFSGADNITFKNMTLTGGRQNGIELMGSLQNRDRLVNISENVNFEDLVISCFGGDGIHYKDTYEAYNSSVSGCRIVDMGMSGIRILAGDAMIMKSCGITITDNEFDGIARVKVYQQPAIMVLTTSGYYQGTPDLYIANNKIHNTNESALFLGVGGTAEYNEIYECTKYGDDYGAIYWGWNYANRGRKFNYNYIHDIKSGNIQKSHGIHGLYLDGATDVEVVGNVIANIDDGCGLYSSGSGYHQIHDNIIANANSDRDVNAAIRMEAGKTEDLRDETIGEMDESGYPYNSPLWIAKYPLIAQNLRNEHPYVAASKLYRNAVVGSNKGLNIGDQDTSDSFAYYEDNVVNNGGAFNFNALVKGEDDVGFNLPDGFVRSNYKLIGSISDKVKGMTKNSKGAIYMVGTPLYIEDGEIKTGKTIKAIEAEYQSLPKLQIGSITAVGDFDEEYLMNERVTKVIMRMLDRY